MPRLRQKDQIASRKSTEFDKETKKSGDVLKYSNKCAIAFGHSVVELGISMADLAKKLGLTLSAVSYAVRRGERKKRNKVI
jgi:DNA-binding MarR family transcriptional regulator